MIHRLLLKMASTFLHAYFRAFQTEFVSFFDNFVSFPHAVSGLDDWLQTYSTAQNVENLRNDHSNVTVDNRACFSTAFFKPKVTYIITSWNLAHLLRKTLCACATLQCMKIVRTQFIVPAISAVRPWKQFNVEYSKRLYFYFCKFFNRI
jgi:hypothetical protein